MNRALLFILVLFAITLGLVYWTGNDEDAAQQGQAQLVDQPDGIAEDLQVRQFDDKGQLSMQVNADSMTHFSLRQETWLTAPRFELYDQEQHKPWQIRADQAKVTGQRLVDLKNGVIIQSLTDDAPVRRVDTDNLQLDLVQKTMDTDAPVTIIGPGYVTSGVGLEAELEGQQVRLKSQVSTEYEQPKDYH
ncbi:LPS export ABC transporter periplasmic protein LptC [Gallaecimonas xiamenensis]|uniref:Lipopolysaccharide export system protein LptC n=1 Tax=Gallaecimonas xiamenensis 3-C-1 TaxID=745411 RepID=K2IMS8_9GAMM|nr:LPS export ABC transporter periplasmic protein LptC [Gallaecimonas xiamenensis]EKE71486.1 LPS biogenesis protein, LptC [Gallaecimonas xiamenensis 3-C-1]